MRAARLGALMLATLSSAACHTMRPLTFEELGTTRPARVQVTRTDQSIVTVEGPQMFGDTLAGYVNGRFEEILAADVRQIQVKRRANGRTAALVAAGAVGVAAMIVLVSDQGSYQNPCDSGSSDCVP